MNKRIDNLEFISNASSSRYPEIVKYFYCDSFHEETRCTIAWWKPDNEGYNLEFIGPRPFELDIDLEAFWILAKFGQTILDAKFRLDEWIRDNK